VGLLQSLRLVESVSAPQSTPTIRAQYNPPVFEPDPSSLFFTPQTFITRSDAIAVPSVARAAALIKGVVATLPLHLYKKSTGQELGNPIWLDQPDYRQPRVITLGWTVDALFFYGVAYWEVTELYADDGRPSRFAWVANTRVTVTLNNTNTLVKSYAVDGSERPATGIGSLITFQAMDEGILNRGGRTIRAALNLEKAAAVAAETPIASGYIQNSGADLPEEQITGLLASWKLARTQRSTAYLSSTLKYEPTAFSPKDMMYSEAKNELATEISRLCNVPAYLLSADANASMTYSNVMDERKQFVDMTLRPFIEALEGRFSMNDLTNSQNFVRMSLDDSYLRSDALTRLAVIEKMLALNLITVEQAREMEDLTPNGGTPNAVEL
jgi:HK97 family phage portal protein